MAADPVADPAVWVVGCTLQGSASWRVRWLVVTQ